MVFHSIQIETSWLKTKDVAPSPVEIAEPVSIAADQKETENRPPDAALSDNSKNSSSANSASSRRKSQRLWKRIASLMEPETSTKSVEASEDEDFWDPLLDEQYQRGWERVCQYYKRDQCPYDIDWDRDSIGRGAGGIVARGRKGDRSFAIKVQDCEDDVIVLERLLEADIMKQVTQADNQHIVSVVEAFFVEFEGNYVAPYQVFLVMELCDGSLASLIKERDAPFPEVQVRKFVIQLATALSVLHSTVIKHHNLRNHSELRGTIIHRDIKPANILIVRSPSKKEGEQEEEITLKLADFGVARVIDCTSESAGVVDPRVGSRNFMAPEVFNNDRYSSAVDLFSMGAVLFVLCTNKSMNFTKRAMEPDARSFFDSELPRTYSIPLRALVLDLLSCTPSRRPTADVILRSLWVIASSANSSLPSSRSTAQRELTVSSDLTEALQSMHDSRTSSLSAAAILRRSTSTATPLPINRTTSSIVRTKSTAASSSPNRTPLATLVRTMNTPPTLSEASSSPTVIIPDVQGMAMVLAQLSPVVESAIEALSPRTLSSNPSDLSTVVMDLISHQSSEIPIPENTILENGPSRRGLSVADFKGTSITVTELTEDSAVWVKERSSRKKSGGKRQVPLSSLLNGLAYHTSEAADRHILQHLRSLKDHVMSSLRIRRHTDTDDSVLDQLSARMSKSFSGLSKSFTKVHKAKTK
eukprot:CAMPEP_0184675022 /NCGR_PEP_ID=MMETSP0308-20130426/87553_1 /TAXON_ID=38269 /ORGANISM="Gloeochaete witrockiana, Strain SAG 46.84" /LENGTH=699 /DNA_ID=CAMNT_0027122691 /DNA_START=110 /DNA_END=2209 /DNA_ORIENTATION=+